MPSVDEIFASKGIPSTIWQPIMAIESGGNPRAHTVTANEDSVGLFQLNRAGGLGTGYSVGELADSTTNATIAANAMAPAYSAGVSKGLSGIDLLRYTAYNSGWPTSAGVKALNTDPVVQSYDSKLVKAAGGDSSVTVPTAGAGGAFAGGLTSDSKIAQIFFVALGGALLLMGFKVITDVPVVIEGG